MLKLLIHSLYLIPIRDEKQLQGNCFYCPRRLPPHTQHSAVSLFVLNQRPCNIPKISNYNSSTCGTTSVWAFTTLSNSFKQKTHLASIGLLSCFTQKKQFPPTDQVSIGYCLQFIKWTDLLFSPTSYKTQNHLFDNMCHTLWWPFHELMLRKQ